MKQQKALTKLLYGYIGFAFLMVILSIFDIFRPLTDILAAATLLVACYSIGKYGNLPRK